MGPRGESRSCSGLQVVGKSIFVDASHGSATTMKKSFRHIHLPGILLGKSAVAAAVIIAATMLTSGADPGAPEGVDPKHGTVSESGVFMPRSATGEPAALPAPAERLAELGLSVDAKVLKIGRAELDRETMTVTIPAVVNMVEGVVEYLLVHRNGKVHEAVFATDAQPQDIHIACLLAGWDPQEKPTAIGIEVIWETNGPPRRYPAEELIAIAEGHPQARSGRHIEPGPWHYTGSRIDAAGFVASREGSIIAMITDPTALVGNPRPGRHDDSLHVPNRERLPAVGHPVSIILRKQAPAQTPDPEPDPVAEGTRDGDQRR